MSRIAPHPELPSGAWRADPRRSSGALLAHGPRRPEVAGRFAVLDARLSTAGGRTSLTVAVATASLALARRAPVAGPDAPEPLDAARFPLLRFASTSVRRCGAQVEVHGDLTVRAVARPLRALGTVVASHDRGAAPCVVADLEAVVDPREYGLGHAACLSGAADAAPVCDVVLVVHLELTRA
jgi:polyisoprenoid-binding protein YceI